MNPIDLTPFAEHSQKLPSKFLAQETPKEASQSWSLILSHGTDFVFAWIGAKVTLGIFSLALQNMMVTKSLRLAYAGQVSPATFMLPLMVLSYFFFSYFFNHGQTLGMKILNKRIEMKHHDLRDSFYWAAQSTLLCFSLGLSYFKTQSIWSRFTGEDNLYQNLVSYKEESAVHLLSMMNEAGFYKEENAEEYWEEAA